MAIMADTISSLSLLLDLNAGLGFSCIFIGPLTPYGAPIFQKTFGFQGETCVVLENDI
jgi:hypothetical protein